MPSNFDANIRLKAQDKVSGPIKRITSQFPRLTAATRKANNQFRMMQARTARLTRGFSKMGGRMTSLGRGMSIGLTAPIGLLARAIIKTGASFETSMKKVGVFSRAGGKELAAFTAKAKELGLTTQFKASDAAEAMTALSIAGFEVDEIMESIAPTLNLAGASMGELGQTAQFLSGALRSFGLPATKAGETADKIMATLSSSNVNNVEEFMEAFKLVGPIAKAGLTFNETATAIGLLGNTMFKGSLGGTALRRALINLAAPSTAAKKVLAELNIKDSDIRDSNNNLKSMRILIEKLGPIAKNTGKMVAIFGARAGPAMASLVGQGTEAFDKLHDSIKNSKGRAEEINQVMQEGATGSMKRFMSAVEGLFIAIGESGILKEFTDLTNGISEFIRELSKSNPELLNMGFRVGILLAIIGPLVTVVGLLAMAIGTIGVPLAIIVAGFVAWGVVVAEIISQWKFIKASVPEILKGLITLAGKLALALNPVVAAFRLMKFVGGKVFGFGESNTEATSAVSTKREIIKSNVTLDFMNVPSETRISSEINDPLLNFNLGLAAKL